MFFNIIFWLRFLNILFLGLAVFDYFDQSWEMNKTLESFALICAVLSAIFPVIKNFLKNRKYRLRGFKS